MKLDADLTTYDTSREGGEEKPSAIPPKHQDGCGSREESHVEDESNFPSRPDLPQLGHVGKVRLKGRNLIVSLTPRIIGFKHWQVFLLKLNQTASTVFLSLPTSPGS